MPFSSLWRQLPLGNSDDPGYVALRPTDSAEDNGSATHRDDDLPLTQEKEIPQPRRKLISHALGVMTVLMPSFLQPKDTKQRKLHSTAWLDGLRGVAATLVVIHHSSLLWFSWSIHSAWIPGQTNWFIQLPFIRLIIAGPPQVMIFFVISGYALSYKPIKVSRQGRYDELSSALASSVFRRHPRLFMPAIIVTFCTAILTWLGAFGTEGWGGVAIASRQPPRFDNLYDQLSNWSRTMIGAMDPLGKDMFRGGTQYDPNLWTLPIEFDSSLVIFLCLAAFSRLSSRVRMLFTFAVAFYAEYFLFYPIFLFMSGMLICEIRMSCDERASATASSENSILPSWAEKPRGWLSRMARRVTKNKVLKTTLALVSFISAVYVLGMPEIHRGAGQSPGFITLTSLIPSQFANAPDNFWLPIAAAWLVLTVDHASFLQVLFTNRFAQYLGKISFALYLVHGPLLWTLGFVLGKKCLDIVGNTSNESYVFAMALAAALWWPVAIYFADLTQRFVDAKCVNFSKWAYDRLVKRQP